MIHTVPLVPVDVEGVPARAEDLLPMALSRPAAAIAAASALLATGPPPAAASTARQARGIARRELGDLREALRNEVGELRSGLLEARRLNLRIAELTDVVTEIVLPLHDRDIDARKLDSLAADTY